MNGETKACQNCKNDFIIEPEDFSFYEKIKVPPPTWCPMCRLQRRLAWRNERTLYLAKCAKCDVKIFSRYDPTKHKNVYCKECWWGDKWDATEYGQDYDFSRPFFLQWKELFDKVPKLCLSQVSMMVDSPYTNLTSNLRNCYLIFNSDYDEFCMYGTELEFSKECIDNTMLHKCELSYECVNCNQCSRTFYSIDCENSTDLWFSKNCRNCTDCFGCVNLRGQKYNIFNVPYSREEYKQKIQELFSGSRESIQELIKKRDELSRTLPIKFMHGQQNVSVTGEYISNSKNTKETFIAIDSQNVKYSMWLLAPTTKDSYDYTEFGDGAELMYEVLTAGGGVKDVQFTVQCNNSSANIRYGNTNYSSENCFGSVAVRHKKYCILNKEYLKEEYEAMLPKIREHMDSIPYVDKQGNVLKYGEFFPTEFSPFSYNETSAQEFLPFSKEEAIRNGFSWKDLEDKSYEPTLKWSDLPQTISGVKDEITKEVILCRAWDEDKDHAMEHGCTKAFRITPQELEFYKRFDIPLPEFCPYSRIASRIKYRNPIKLYDSSCSCGGPTSKNGKYKNSGNHFHGAESCPNTFKTSYDSQKGQIVYCEQCYQQEVY